MLTLRLTRPFGFPPSYSVSAKVGPLGQARDLRVSFASPYISVPTEDCVSTTTAQPACLSPGIVGSVHCFDRFTVTFRD